MNNKKRNQLFRSKIFVPLIQQYILISRRFVCELLYCIIMLQTARGLACFSLVAGFFGLLLSIVGLECTKCVDDNQKTKSRIALIASACWILSAFTIGIAVSYYANQVR